MLQAFVVRSVGLVRVFSNFVVNFISAKGYYWLIEFSEVGSKADRWAKGSCFFCFDPWFILAKTIIWKGRVSLYSLNSLCWVKQMFFLLYKKLV